MPDMSARAGDRIQQDHPGEVPNIAIYDWRDNADPGGEVDPRKLELLRKLEKLRLSLALWHAAKYGWKEVGKAFGKELALPDSEDAALAADFLVDLAYVRPLANTTGQELAAWMWEQANASQPRINADKPVHLIGHSAGGFVVGACAAKAASALEWAVFDRRSCDDARHTVSVS